MADIIKNQRRVGVRKLGRNMGDEKSIKTNRPKVGIGVYILNDKGELLLLKRKGAHGEGTWSPPGGHLEMGESFEECAIRETKEETNLEITNLEVVGLTNDIFSDRHYITIAMKAKRFKGALQIMEADRCEQIDWFPLDHLPKPLFLPLNNFLKENLAKLKTKSFIDEVNQ